MRSIRPCHSTVAGFTTTISTAHSSTTSAIRHVPAHTAAEPAQNQILFIVILAIRIGLQLIDCFSAALLRVVSVSDVILNLLSGGLFELAATASIDVLLDDLGFVNHFSFVLGFTLVEVTAAWEVTIDIVAFEFKQACQRAVNITNNQRVVVFLIWCLTTIATVIILT